MAEIHPKSITYTIMVTFDIEKSDDSLLMIGECVQDALEKLQEQGEANVVDMKVFGE
jgi:hypothetical protein